MMARGDRREAIVRDDADRATFVRTLAEASVRSGFRAGAAGGLAPSPPGWRNLSEDDGKPSLRCIRVCAGDGSSVRRDSASSSLGCLPSGPRELRRPMATTERNSTITPRDGRPPDAGGARTLWDGSGNAAAGTQGRLAQRACCGPHSEGDDDEIRLDWISEQLNTGTRAGTSRLATETRRRLATERGLRRRAEAISKIAILNG